MKKSMLAAIGAMALFVLLPSNGMAQGQVFFDSIGLSFPSPTTTGRVFNTDTVTALSGSSYTAQLWGSTSSDPNSFVLLETKVGFETGGDAGRISVPTATTTAFAGGSTLFYEVKAWNNAGGSITSYDSASVRGVSQVASVALTTSPASPNFTDNFLNFSLAATVVPEPSTILLGLVGGIGLLLRRRK